MKQYIIWEILDDGARLFSCREDSLERAKELARNYSSGSGHQYEIEEINIVFRTKGKITPK